MYKIFYYGKPGCTAGSVYATQIDDACTVRDALKKDGWKAIAFRFTATEGSPLTETDLQAFAIWKQEAGL